MPKTPKVSHRYPLSQRKEKRNQRICVLVRGQSWEPLIPGRACLSRIHGHCSLAKAAQMVEDGAAEWVRSEWTTPRGRARSKMEPAIRLVAKRRWCPTPSKDGRGTMKVLQLVP